jgi:two-component system phosphate regulon sensor histidine kinase PhoR
MDPLAVAALLAGLAIGAGSAWVIATRAPRRASRVDPLAPASAPARPASPADLWTEPEVVALAAVAPVGIVHVDDAMHFTGGNPVAASMLGQLPSDLRGRSVMEAFLDVRVEALVLAARDGTPGSIELPARGREGRHLVLRARPSPSGGVWLALEDVGELRRLQQIRAEFIDNLSHELRTPLTTVSLLAETLARDATAAGDAIPPRMRDRIGKVEEETGHLVQMVNELLDLSRIESGPPLLLLDEVDVARLATTSTERLRLFAERQGVHLAVDATDGLPHVRGNGERLGQVFVNLVHNAVKFSPDGGDVTVRVYRDGDQVAVAVEDHGIGIPAADRARVFERFYKVDRARVRGGGTGLGLSIARHIVEAHGGRIDLVSREGEGSTFTVRLPPSTTSLAVEPSLATGSAGAAAS